MGYNEQEADARRRLLPVRNFDGTQPQSANVIRSINYIRPQISEVSVK